jgi:hypothetical protein
MKTFILALLVLATTAVGAAEITVLDTQIPMLRGRTSVDTKFYIDQNSHEGFAKVTVTEEEYITHYPTGFCDDWGYGGGYGRRHPGDYYGNRYGRYGHNRCFPRTTTIQRTVLEEKVKIDGLVLEGTKVMYNGADAVVECGNMGVSRVLKVPTFYLSGKCKLEGRIFGNKVQVKFKAN